MRFLQIVDIMATGGYIERREYRKKTRYVLFNRRKFPRARVSGEQMEVLYKRGVLKEASTLAEPSKTRKYKSTLLILQNIERVSKLCFRVVEPDKKEIRKE